MAGDEERSVTTYKVLITLYEDARDAIERVYAELLDLGLQDAEIASPLGGIIAGEATNADLAKMRALPEVYDIGPEPIFTALD